jgi:FHS family L-fucose permease-like MFS transporter
MFSAISGVLFSILAVLTTSWTSVTFIALLGLSNAIMWPAIWPLAIGGLGKYTKLGSSFLIMAVAGGAIMPLVYGMLSDAINPQMAYLINIPSYLFILYFATLGYKVGRK